MLSDSQKRALLAEVHRAIEDGAAWLSDVLRGAADTRDIAYPPNGGLSEAEREALGRLRERELTDAQLSALRKLTADAAARPLFVLFSLFDGTIDPEGYEDPWPVFELVESDTSDLLGESWLEAYWEGQERREERGWTLHQG